MHDAGYVHQDIKPWNLVWLNGELQLVDWGLFETRESVTHISGSPGYFDTALCDTLETARKISMEQLQQGEVWTFALVMAEMFRLTAIGTATVSSPNYLEDCKPLTREVWQQREPTSEPSKQPVLKLVKSILFAPLGKRPTIDGVIASLTELATI